MRLQAVLAPEKGDKAILLTLQLHHRQEWHDAATVELFDVAAGHRGRTLLEYEPHYWFAMTQGGVAAPIDARAVSVATPVDQVRRQLRRWPAFMLDVLPQGHARRRLLDTLGLNDTDPGADLPLLLRGGGAPIGNLRIREAAEAEADRIAAIRPRGVPTSAVLDLTDEFRDLLATHAMMASGSSGVQGEWPKALLTRAQDGLWYPDPFVADEDARQHSIVKLARADHREDALILEAEAPYLEVARAFGLRVAEKLTYAPGVLLIPRFDREGSPDGVVRLGQESIVAASGIARFGYVGSHETYLDTIRRVCTDPAAEITEYVLRDVLNQAMGNPDNHGRNTALQKFTDGTVRLTPLFDFTPMRLDPRMVGPSTTWACLDRRAYVDDWRTVCEAAAGTSMEPRTLMRALAGKAAFLRDLPARARDAGVPADVLRVIRGDEIAARFEELGRELA